MFKLPENGKEETPIPQGCRAPSVPLTGTRCFNKVSTRWQQRHFQKLAGETEKQQRIYGEATQEPPAPENRISVRRETVHTGYRDVSYFSTEKYKRISPEFKKLLDDRVQAEICPDRKEKTDPTVTLPSTKDEMAIAGLRLMDPKSSLGKYIQQQIDSESELNEIYDISFKVDLSTLAIRENLFNQWDLNKLAPILVKIKGGQFDRLNAAEIGFLKGFLRAFGQLNLEEMKAHMKALERLNLINMNVLNHLVDILVDLDDIPPMQRDDMLRLLTKIAHQFLQRQLQWNRDRAASRMSFHIPLTLPVAHHHMDMDMDLVVLDEYDLVPTEDKEEVRKRPSFGGKFYMRPVVLDIPKYTSLYKLFAIDDPRTTYVKIKLEEKTKKAVSEKHASTGEKETLLL